MKRLLGILAVVVFVAVAVSGALLLAGKNPAVTARLLVEGAFGSAGAVSGTLQEALPLLIAGIAAFVALRAGLFNIGVDGQLTVGALAATVVALRVTGPAGIGLAALTGMVAGALWAAPAGLIRAYRGGSEVISTIMLNNIALFGTNALVAHAFRDPNASSPTTAAITSKLPLIMVGGVEVSSAVIVGLLLAGLLAWVLAATVGGYELRAVGANPTAAQFAGIEAKRVMLRAMLISGAIAGLAGAFQVLALEGRFYSGFSPGYGFNALGVALLAGPSALAIIPAALAFGGLQRGGVALAAEGIDKGITDVVVGGLILIAAVVRYARGRSHD